MKLRVRKFVTEMNIGAFVRGAYDVIGADLAIARRCRHKKMHIFTLKESILWRFDRSKR